MKDIIYQELVRLFDNTDIDLNLAACKIANTLTLKGYGLVGFGGPSQIYDFMNPIQPTTVNS
jgi:hypothetical protein